MYVRVCVCVYIYICIYIHNIYIYITYVRIYIYKHTLLCCYGLSSELCMQYISCLFIIIMCTCIMSSISNLFTKIILSDTNIFGVII